MSVHRSDCPNLAYYYNNDTERLIEVEWDVDAPATYQVEIEVKAIDRPLLTRDILNTIADTKTIINAVNSRAKK